MAVLALILGLLTVTGAVRLLGGLRARSSPRRRHGLRQPGAAVVRDGARRARSRAQRGHAQLRARECGARGRAGGRRHPDRHGRRLGLLPRQRRQLRRRDRVAAAARPLRPAPQHSRAAQPRPAARGPALRREHARAGRPAGDDGRDRRARLRVPGRAPDRRARDVRRRRRGLRLPDRRHGRGCRRRRADRGRQRAHGHARRDHRLLRIRRLDAARSRGPDPAARARRDDDRRRRQRDRPRRRQQHAAAGRPARHARARDEPLGRRVPRHDADRRADRRMGLGDRRRPRGPAHGRHHVHRRRRRSDELPLAARARACSAARASGRPEALSVTNAGRAVISSRHRRRREHMPTVKLRE